MYNIQVCHGLHLSSEDDINIEHTFSFEPTASESGGTNVRSVYEGHSK